MILFLIGFRGSGKTTIGKSLAQKLKAQFIDLDEEIEKKTNMTIPEIFQKFGEKYFRDVETQVLKEILGNTREEDRYVVSAGGGIIEREENREIIKGWKGKGMKVIWLKVSPEVAYERIKDDKHRPALTTKKDLLEEIKFLISKREKFYKELADVIVETDDKTVESIVEIILKAVKF